MSAARASLAGLLLCSALAAPAATVDAPPDPLLLPVDSALHEPPRLPANGTIEVRITGLTGDEDLSAFNLVLVDGRTGAVVSRLDLGCCNRPPLVLPIPAAVLEGHLALRAGEELLLRWPQHGEAELLDAPAAGPACPPELAARVPACAWQSADLTGADLSGLDLSRQPLARLDLRGARLDDANLRGTDLAGALLANASLEGADLSGARLLAADLSGASLFVADLGGADLSLAVLRGAILVNANLANARLRGADLSGADISGVALDGADLTDAVCPDGLPATDRACRR